MRSNKMRGRNVLVVCAHADDEVLGCGGAIARHVDQGDLVSLLVLADGVSSRSVSDDVNLAVELSERSNALGRASLILGIDSVTQLNFPDNRLDTIPLIEIIRQIEKVIEEQRPSLIYTHHYGDLNVDHRKCFEAVLTACRPLPLSSVEEIYTFEVLSSTDYAAGEFGSFIPNHFVNISGFLDKKLSALEVYEAEMRAPPHSRSLEHVKNLAEYRGGSVGLFYAEAFMTIRQLIK